MKIQFIMSEKEQQYEKVCIEISNNKLSLQDAATHTKVHIKTMRRIYKKYQLGGAQSLCHKLRNIQGRAQIDPDQKKYILSLITSECLLYNPAHIVDTLKYKYKIKVSAPTIRAWMREVGLLPEVVKSKKKCGSSHRIWRAPRAQFGAMIQCDGSFYPWMGNHLPYCCLLVLIDDATNIIHIRLAEQEYARDMLILLHNWIKIYGIPESLYFDRRNAYVETNKALQHIPQVCHRLGITILNAHSPQAFELILV